MNEREARTISTLSHPYICTLHDIGQLVRGGEGEGEGADTIGARFLLRETNDG